MKKIEFGINEDETLSAQWSGIEGYNGEYLDTVKLNGNNYLVTRIVDSYRKIEGDIDVKEVMQDYYSDGSYVTYSNMEKNPICQKMQQYLNSESVKRRITDGESIVTILRGAGFPVTISNLQQIYSESETVNGIVTSVRPGLFEKLRESKKYNMGMSMYMQSQEIARLRAELARLKNNDSERTTGRRF